MPRPYVSPLTPPTDLSDPLLLGALLASVQLGRGGGKWGIGRSGHERREALGVGRMIVGVEMCINPVGCGYVGVPHPPADLEDVNPGSEHQ